MRTRETGKVRRKNRETERPRFVKTLRSRKPISKSAFSFPRPRLSVPAGLRPYVAVGRRYTPEKRPNRRNSRYSGTRRNVLRNRRFGFHYGLRSKNISPEAATRPTRSHALHALWALAGRTRRTASIHGQTGSRYSQTSVAVSADRSTEHTLSGRTCTRTLCGFRHFFFRNSLGHRVV